MANEIKLKNTLTVTRGNLKIVKDTIINIDLDSSIYSAGSIDLVDDVLTPIPLGELQELGRAWFRNLDDLNTIIIGSIENDSAQDFRPFIEIPPGEVADLRLYRGLFPYARVSDGVAGTGSEGQNAILEYVILSRGGVG